jgi:hypothetical protein
LEHPKRLPGNQQWQPAMANEQVPWNILFIVVDDEETHSKRLSRNGETLQCELTRRLAKDQFF